MRKVESLVEDIYCNIQHGECLYDREMFDSLIADIQNLIDECHREFLSNQEQET